MTEIPVHYVMLRAFSYTTESNEKVKKALKLFLPPETKVEFQELEGNFGNKIILFRSKIEKSREIRDLIHKIKTSLTENQIKELERQIEKRTDEDCNLFLRFNKQDAYKEKLSLTNSGNSINIRFKIAAYPAKKQKAINTGKQLFQKDWS
ncbi:Exosome subunit RNA binding protein with dsRBD fold [Methanonatronarchaeum thermophilum]|uniref:Exosome subunit RNA binding protein with dsRBD fold n=1 Tax=Methanonatronarchaeum thermophilum TaxID=1927129 RepID=A0A1Y3GCE3_9EURY|nr:RNA-binding protein [Methanonatronarchaeum thermophilum]OUJ19069.1 Exosome subunit RNA binding protein with dsRBD fold [Methanonatronarchaeum thermophilum]